MDEPGPDRRAGWSRWWRVWTSASLPGVGLAILAWGPGQTAAVAGVMAMSATLVLVLLRADRAGPGPTPPEPPSLPLAPRAACVAALGISTLLLATVLPVLLLVVAPLQVASAPPSVARWRRRGRTRTATASATPDPGPAVPDDAAQSWPTAAVVVSSMDDAALCRAWRLSYWVLLDAAGPSQRCAAVVLRHELLAELEARDPGAVAAWLTSGARPSGGPDRYLGGDGRR